MTYEQGTFTTKYTINIRPVDALGVLAGMLLILSPMMNPHVTVGLGIAFLLWVGFCQVVRNIRKGKSS
jgi:hypothetical protein